MLSSGKVRDPVSAIVIITAVSPHLVVDKSFDPMTMAVLGR